MPRTIHIAAALPASPDELFDMYLDPELHAAITGAPASSGHVRVPNLAPLTVDWKERSSRWCRSG